MGRTMNQPMSEQPMNDENDGINLGQVIEFIGAEWRRLAVGAAVGLVLGGAGWAVLAGYKAESVLVNNGAVNFLSWRGLQKNLPLLASQMLELKQVRADDEPIYRQMASAQWWAKNVVPTYSLSKADTKDLPSISKELQESGGTTILNLVVTAKGDSKEAALEHVTTSTQFIKQGSAYLSIKNLVQGWDAQILNTEVSLAKKITDTEVELRYQRQRAANLESLRQRFPANANVSSQQVVDLKDSSAKYMPISTQLVAINTDINSANETLERMRNDLSKTKVMADFVKQAKPVVDKTPDGLAVVEQLLDIVKLIRGSVDASDVNANQQLNSLEADLIGVRTNFQRNLDTDLIPQVSRSGPMQPLAGGLLGGFVVTLLYALGRRAYGAYRNKGA